VKQNLPVPAFYVSIIPKEIMAYKQQIKESELVTKIRIIRAVKGGAPIVQVAESFSCHRNTVGNIMKTFEASIKAPEQQRLLQGKGLSQEEMHTLYSMVLNKSRKPLTHKKAATQSQEDEIKKLFKDEGLKVGSARMFHILKRRYRDHEAEDTAKVLSLTPAQLRGIYKRQELLPEKTRSS
jgi:hypothetical protein